MKQNDLRGTLNRTTAAIAAAAIASAVTVPAASAAPVPPCTAHQLHLTLGHERANTGHVSYTLTATDEGPACILAGFPRLGLEDAHGKHLPSVTTDTGKARRVLLLYGLSAQAAVSYGTDGEAGAESAAWLTAGGKAVHMPGGIAWIYGGQLNTTTWKKA